MQPGIFMLQTLIFTCSLVYIKNIVLCVTISNNLLIGPSWASAFHVVQRAYYDSQEKNSTACWQCLQTFAIFVFSLLDFHTKPPRASKLELLLTFSLLREQTYFTMEKRNTAYWRLQSENYLYLQMLHSLSRLSNVYLNADNICYVSIQSLNCFFQPMLATICTGYHLWLLQKKV